MTKHYKRDPGCNRESLETEGVKGNHRGNEKVDVYKEQVKGNYEPRPEEELDYSVYLY